MDKKTKQANKNNQSEKKEPDKTHMAKALCGGIYSNAFITSTFSGLNNTGVGDIAVGMVDVTNHVQKGNLSSLEDMLVSQAIALDTIFSHLAIRSHNNMGHYLDTADKYLKLALKAQNQCRMTIETLAEIKNPKPYIQHNRAINQQVNNGMVADERAKPEQYAHAGENQKTGNELLDNSSMDVIQQPKLEHNSHEQQWMDTGTPGTTSRTDKAMATMEA